MSVSDEKTQSACDWEGDTNTKTCAQIGTDFRYKHKIVWSSMIGLLVLHVLAIWGLFILLSGGVGLKTVLWTWFVLCLATEGLTIGAHRLFSHNSFKASPALRAALLILHTITGQNTMFKWCRDHREHHLYTDTDADPHNAKRGFFFSHVGWLMTKTHPYVIKFGKKVDTRDLEADWMVMFQKRHYFPLHILFSMLIPVGVPIYFFNEPWMESLLVVYFTRYVLQLHQTWAINSIAHRYGTRPYDKNFLSVDSLFLSILTQGEGWHNYHHAFPCDYKAAELPNHINLSTKYIDFFEKIGLASHLKTVDPEMIKNRIKRTGDGTHFELGNDEARNSVTAIGPLHPLNPSYTTTFAEPTPTLTVEGTFHYDNGILDCSNVTVRRNIGATNYCQDRK